MNRLLQGDVGSGKTAVAYAAALQVARAGRQTAVLEERSRRWRKQNVAGIAALGVALLAWMLLSRALTGDRIFLGAFEQAPGCINVLDVDRTGSFVVRAVGYTPYDLFPAGATGNAAKAKELLKEAGYPKGLTVTLTHSNAKDFESRCGRVSIGEVVGQVTYRCEILARPCKPPMKETAQTSK